MLLLSLHFLWFVTCQLVVGQYNILLFYKSEDCSLYVHKRAMSLSWLKCLSSRAVNECSKFKYIFKYIKNGDSMVKINIPLWKKTHQQLLCEWAHGMMGQGQVTGVAFAQLTHCWEWDATKNVASADGREKNVMAESSEPNSAAERVVWTPSNLKSPVWCKLTIHH